MPRHNISKVGAASACEWRESIHGRNTFLHAQAQLLASRSWHKNPAKHAQTYTSSPRMLSRNLQKRMVSATHNARTLPEARRRAYRTRGFSEVPFAAAHKNIRATKPNPIHSATHSYTFMTDHPMRCTCKLSQAHVRQISNQTWAAKARRRAAGKKKSNTQPLALAAHSSGQWG